MKKTIISLAVAAGMAASGAAFAGPTVYGNLHVSLDSPDTENAASESIEMASQTSAIGVKGSEDLGDGMKAFYKAEFQVDVTEAGSLTGRDQYVGMKGGMGTVKLGTMSSNYKQKGSSVDPMYRTALEGRGDLHMQSGLHGGSGRFGGRMKDTLQYASPKMGGMQMVLNVTFDDANTSGDTGSVIDIDETKGFGFRYESKTFTAFIDMMDVSYENVDDTDPLDIIGLDTVTSESIIKFGGTFKAGPVKLGIQLEQTEDLLGSDYMMFSANYKINRNNFIYLTMGQRDDVTDGGTTLSESGSTSVAVMYNHKMSKKTNIYVGYGDRSADDNATEGDYSIATAGLRVKF